MVGGGPNVVDLNELAQSERAESQAAGMSFVNTESVTDNLKKENGN